jgi:enamine deaminase RidA (YjgF/YER057c/UK114 family)
VGPSCLYPPIYCPIPSTFQLAVLNNEKYPLIFTSGILGKNNEKLENKIAQTGAALDNLESILRMSKSSLNRILRLNVYIKDKEFMDDVFTELKQRF